MEGLSKSVKLDQKPVTETDDSETVAERSIYEVPEKKEIFPYTADLDQENIDEIQTDEPVLDKDDVIVEHCNDGSVDVPNFRSSFKLNALAEEFVYRGVGVDLNVTNVNKDIYNPDEMPTNDLECPNNDYCNDGSVDVPNFRSLFKLNALAEEYVYRGVGVDLNVTNVNKDIYNPDEMPTNDLECPNNDYCNDGSVDVPNFRSLFKLNALAEEYVYRGVGVDLNVTNVNKDIYNPDEMPTNDLECPNIDHCNYGSVDVPNFRSSFKLNALAEEFVYRGGGVDLNVTNVNKDIYNPVEMPTNDLECPNNDYCNDGSVDVPNFRSSFKLNALAEEYVYRGVGVDLNVTNVNKDIYNPDEMPTNDLECPNNDYCNDGSVDVPNFRSLFKLNALAEEYVYRGVGVDLNVTNVNKDIYNPDEMPTNDLECPNIDHCNYGSVDVPNFRSSFKLNALAEEFVYRGGGVDLNVTNVNKDIYNPVEMPTNDLECPNNDYCNDGSVDVPNFRSSFQLNALAEEFVYRGGGVDLNVTNVNKDIYNPVEMPTNDLECPNNDYCNDGSVDVPNFRSSFKLNALAEEFVYRGGGVDLNVTNVNKDIYNPDEMPTNDLECPNNDYCNDGSVDVPNFRSSFKLNALAEEFVYRGGGVDLNVTNVNKDIYNPVEMPTYDLECPNNDYCNDGSVDVPNFRSSFKLNALAEEFVYRGGGVDLNVTNVNKDIYNPDEMPTNDLECPNIDHCNYGSVDVPNFRSSFKLNALAEEFVYRGGGVDLNVTNVNKDIYNPVEMPTNDLECPNNDYCNDGSVDVPNFRSSFKLNALAEEFVYHGGGVDLNVTNVNKDIYNPDEMPTNDFECPNIDHCNDSGIDILMNEMPTNQDVSIMGVFNGNINYTNVKPTSKPKLLRRLFKNFRRRSKLNDDILISGNINSDSNEMLTNKPCSHQNSLIMDNCDENINSANAKPKLLTRIFKCFRRTSTSESNEMTKIDIPILDQDFSNTEHINDNTIKNSNVKQKSKRNPISKFFRYLRRVE